LVFVLLGSPPFLFGCYFFATPNLFLCALCGLLGTFYFLFSPPSSFRRLDRSPKAVPFFPHRLIRELRDVFFPFLFSLFSRFFWNFDRLFSPGASLFFELDFPPLQFIFFLRGWRFSSHPSAPRNLSLKVDTPETRSPFVDPPQFSLSLFHLLAPKSSPAPPNGSFLIKPLPFKEATKGPFSSDKSSSWLQTREITPPHGFTCPLFFLRVSPSFPGSLIFPPFCPLQSPPLEEGSSDDKSFFARSL